MNQTETKRFLGLYEKFEAGNREEALQEFRELARNIDEPWDRAELSYHETLWLLELDRVAEARLKLEDLKKAVSSLTGPPPDGYQTDLPISLTVMARYAELKVLLAEKNETLGLQVLEELVSRYPKQLSAPGFEEVLKEINLHLGLLLADAGRWAEARPFLETASYPAEWKGIILYYRGHSYYQSREYQRAESELVGALSIGLAGHWEGRAHYVLGIVEHHLGDMEAAKNQFELCLKTADPVYLSTTRIWEWLEATSQALGLHDEAEMYRQRKLSVPPGSKPN